MPALKHFGLKHFSMFKNFAAIGAGGASGLLPFPWRRRRR
jgi:hypothetical protein